MADFEWIQFDCKDESTWPKDNCDVLFTVDQWPLPLYGTFNILKSDNVVFDVVFEHIKFSTSSIPTLKDQILFSAFFGQNIKWMTIPWSKNNEYTLEDI